MGAADVVPGVSGGTIAFITGIYEELLHTIAHLNFTTFKKLFSEGFGSFWKAINGQFLLPLITGIGLSIISLAHVVTWAIKTHPLIVWAFFFGLIVASILLVGRQINKWNLFVVLALFIGAFFAYYITLLEPGNNETGLLYLFISGLVAICAMILPGISGAFILLLLGSYGEVLSAIKEFNLVKILVFASGCLIGLLSFSRLLSWAFKKQKNIIIAILTGFLVGSLNKVWPWKQVITTRINSHGEAVPLIEKNILPDMYAQLNGSPHLVGVIFAAIIGVILVLGIDALGRLWKTKNQEISEL